MGTLLFSHPDCLLHREPPGHPEQAARLLAVDKALAGFDLDRREAPVAARADVLRCHPEAYLARVERAVPQAG